MALVWTFLTIALVCLEAATAQFVCIWFAGGSFVSLIAALCSVSVGWQWVIFVISSLIFLILTRPFVRKFNVKSKEKTNIDAHIGKICVVKEEIDNLNAKGVVVLGGIEWSARSLTDEIIEKGGTVKIIKIEGVKLIVERV